MSESPELSRGVANPRVVDLVHLDPESEEVVLGVLEERAWGSAPDQLRQLQDKLNAYLAYALDGHLAADYPAYAGKRLRLELDCVEVPGAAERGFLVAFRNYADSQGLGFRVRPRPIDDARLERGMQEQLRRRRASIEAGARHVGWKVALTNPAAQRRLGVGAPLVGALLSTTSLADGVAALDPDGDYAVEAEVAVRLDRDLRGEADRAEAAAAIGALMPAIELVNRALPRQPLEALLAAGVMHAGFRLGSPWGGGRALPKELSASLRIGGTERASFDPGSRPDPPELLRGVARTLVARGERLRAGDHVLLGALAEPVPVEPGARVEIDVPPLGSLDLRV